MHRDEETILEDIEGSIDFSDFLYPRQTAVVNDPALLRVVFGGRRSSKSVLIAAESLMVADQFQGMSIPYCSSSITNGLDILMPYIRQLDKEHNLKLFYHLSDHKVFTPGGGCVQFYGWGSKSEIEKGRGLKIPALYVDESGKISQSLLKRGITETFGPATADFQGVGGRGILMSGNPDYVPGSYWNKMCGGNTGVSEFGASVHHMTIFNNLFFEGRADSVVEEFCRQNKMKRSDSVVQREWYGRFCVDSDGLAYPHWKGIVHPMHLMPLGGYTSLGLDLGSDHPCAWVVIRWVLTESVDVASNVARYIHHGHVLETYEESGLMPNDVAAITREFQKAYNVGVTHGDSGGGGKMTIEHLRDVMGIDIQPVSKAAHKEDRIWMLDGMLGNGTMHVHDRCQTLIEQLASVPKERKSNGRFDHMCLTGDTMVATSAGHIPISLVQSGDSVLTRSGWRNVLRSWKSRDSAPIWQVDLSSGESIRGTCNHPVWVIGKGWTRIDRLGYGDQVCPEPNESNSKALSSVGTLIAETRQTLTTSHQTAHTECAASGVCTRKSGELPMALYLPDMTSTTRTATRSTMSYPTSNALNPYRISGDISLSFRCTSSIAQCAESCMRASARALYFAAAIANHEHAEIQGSMMKQGAAQFAEGNTRATDTAAKNAAGIHVLRSYSTGEREPVYDLEVEGAHEFFGNGVLLHNSGYADHSLDAAHYCILAAKQHLTELDLGPKIGSRDWAKQQVKRDQAAVQKQLLRSTSRRSEMMQRLSQRRSGR